MWGEYLLKTTEYAPCTGVQLKAGRVVRVSVDSHWCSGCRVWGAGGGFWKRKGCCCLILQCIELPGV